jgi:hypothetical protein
MSNQTDTEKIENAPPVASSQGAKMKGPVLCAWNSSTKTKAVWNDGIENYRRAEQSYHKDHASKSQRETLGED